MTYQIDKNTVRIAAIDWLRGIVMILMALDHTSWFFNEQRIFADSILLYEPGILLDSDQFLTRWITHICAPTFVFLAGTSLAISQYQRQQQGMKNATIDHELLLRGAFIALLDLFLFSLVSGKPVLQVLYAIGISMMLMVYLQRLGMRNVLLIALLILAGNELLLLIFWEPAGEVPLWLALAFAPVFTDDYTVLYPALPWLSMMMLGWVLGKWLVTEQASLTKAASFMMTVGLFALAAFVVIRGLDGYGNAMLYLEGNTLVQWLHVSKYPPSLAYTLLELGLMAMVLALLMRLESMTGMIRRNEPVIVFGQTALFFYLAHFCVLAVLSQVFEPGDLKQTYWITLLLLIIMYPVCRAYRTLKWRNPKSLLRFL